MLLHGLDFKCFLGRFMATHVPNIVGKDSSQAVVGQYVVEIKKNPGKSSCVIWLLKVVFLI